MSILILVQHAMPLARRLLRPGLGALGVAGLVLLLAAPGPAGAARRRPDPLVAPARITKAALAKPGARVRVRVRRGTRVLEVKLLRRRGGRTHVFARRLRRVHARRHGRRIVVRLRVRAAVMRRLQPGVYVIRVRTRRGSRHWSRHVLRQRIRVVARRAPGADAAPTAPGTSPGTTAPGSAATPPPPGPVTIAAAGDIACGTLCPSTQGTAALIRDVIHPSAVLALGDLQYPDATTARLDAVYDESWGAFKATTYVVPGNHDQAPSRSHPDYVDYFNAGGPIQLVPRASYSFDLGAWHVVALNSECFDDSGCDEAEWERWLRADLAAHPQACTLAFVHRAYWTSPGITSRSTRLEPWIRALYDGGVDVLLQAHVHAYERFAPQDPDSAADPARGIAAFTVGTGGGELVTFSGTPQANSVTRSDTSFGVLGLTLRSGGYDFRFHAVGGGFADAGSGTCH